ncbi:MAG TPA: NAD-dependent epimerase/dehydratase family protein, partial [Gaiellales bacterium]|nr:NAD-dependent epimerase/dehydratase family protein [Gaiellales bacterium]
MTGRVMVTGGLGFIGSAFVRRLVADGRGVLVVDLDTYAGDRRRLAGAAGQVEVATVDVADRVLRSLVERERPPLIVHFAAESHVTRGEDAADAFFRTNVDGTRGVLEAARLAGVSRVLHMSTDEVYGPCPGVPFGEHQKLPGEGLATSAYARSKALADDLALGFADRLDVVVARPTNCVGPYQHPEKAMPRWAIRALRGRPLKVWGGGGQVRDWMWVDDAVDGLLAVIERGVRGTAYNLGPAAEGVTNLEVARLVAGAAGAGPDAIELTEYDR